MGKITDIQQQVRNKNRYSIFIDGEFYMGIEGEILEYLKRKYKFDIGTEIKEEEIKNISLEADYERAKSYAVNYCSDKPEKTVRDKLKQKGYDEEVVGKIIDFMSRYGLINDKRFANSFARDAVNIKKRGKQRIKQELKMKGISAEIIDEAISQIDDEEQLEAALKKLRPKINTYKKKSENHYELRQKCYALLMRNGFEPEVINKAITLCLEHD